MCTATRALELAMDRSLGDGMNAPMDFAYAYNPDRYEEPAVE